MKKNPITPSSQSRPPNPAAQTRTVTLEYPDASAEMVYVAGTFNNWHPRSTPMVPFGHGRWIKEISLAPGTYEYLFVVDGKWVPDRQAHDSVPNPYGGFNSVLKV